MGTTKNTVETTVRILSQNMFGEMEQHFLTLQTNDLAEISASVFDYFGEHEFEIMNTEYFSNAEIN